MTPTILVEAVTRRSAVQKITVALDGLVRPVGKLAREPIVLKEVGAGAALANCRTLINQINAGLYAEKPFVNVSSAAELLLYLECAASALKSSVSRSQERGETKIVAFNYRPR